VILPRSTLTAQPQGPVEVDWNNPLTRGLLTLAIPRGDTMYCVAQRRMYTATSVRPTVGTSLSGLGQRSVNSTIAFSHLPLTAFDLGDATIAVRQVCATLVASARPAGFSRSSSINPAFRVDQNPSAQARPRFGVFNNSGTNLGTITSGAADPVRFSATQAFSMVTAAGATEIRAISEGFVYTPVARTAGTTTVDRFSVGGQSCSTDRLGFEGFVFVAAAWTRALSADEMAEVDQNIWQLFVQPRGRSFVAFGAAAGGTTTSTTSGAWTVRNAQTQTYASAWTLRNAQTRAYSSAWTLRNAQTRAYSSAWTLRNAQTQAYASAWTLRNAQTQTYASAWTLRNAQTQAYASAWTLRNAQTQTYASAWTVASSLSTAFGTNSGAWTVRNAQSQTYPGAWTLKNTQTQTYPSAWSIRDTSGQAFSGAWTVRNGQTALQAGAWSIRNTQTGNRSGAWSVANGQAQTFSGAWTVKNSVVGSFPGSWSVESTIPEQTLKAQRGFIANLGRMMNT
jgi:hypothetical protein